MQKLYRLLQQDEAQTMTEYATVLTVITLFCLAAFALLAAASTGAITRVASSSRSHLSRGIPDDARITDMA